MNSLTKLRSRFLKCMPCILLPIILMLAGCETTGGGIQDNNRALLQQSISAEAPGDYWIGRRHYKDKYYYWGYVRRPGKPWASAQLVMMNEQKTLVPDKVSGQIGSDNNSEYRLDGYFSGETVYEPSSNSFYPEFVLERAQLLNPNPTPIFAPEQQKKTGRNREIFYY